MGLRGDVFLMEYQQLDNLIYNYKRGGRGTGKTTAMLNQAWRWANLGKNVIVVSENDTTSKALRHVFHNQYEVLAEKSLQFVFPRFVAMDRFSHEEGQWRNNRILADPDVWVKLLQESVSSPNPPESPKESDPKLNLTPDQMTDLYDNLVYAGLDSKIAASIVAEVARG